MNDRPKSARHVAWTCALLGVAVVGLARSAWGDQITLKSSVRLPANAQAVCLAQIAELDGAEAARHADLVIAELGDSTEALEISVQQVRAKLTEAGAHWGRIQLAGRKVTVRPRRSSASGVPLAMTPASLDNHHRERQRRHIKDDLRADALVRSPTLRGAIAALIVGSLRVDPQELRLIFDRSDSSILDTPQQAYRFEIEPLGSIRSDRIELSIRAWSETRVEQRWALAVGPLLLRETVVLRHDAARGAQLTEADLTVDPQWLPPSQAGLLGTLVHAVGCTVARGMRAGDVLRHKDLRRKNLIERGDRVIVRCLVGGAVISIHAEARESGAKNQSIAFRKLGERETFQAVVIGKGEAVIDLSGSVRHEGTGRSL